MTAFNQLCKGRQSNRPNAKDRQLGQRRRNLDHFSPEAQAEREAARWEAEGFKVVGQNKWTYTWEGVGFPTVELRKALVVIDSNIIFGIIASVEGAEVNETFGHNSHPANIKPRLDDMIFELMSLQAEVDAPLECEPGEAPAETFMAVG